MTAPRDSDRLIRAFLDDGTDVLPDVVFDVVRRDIHRTRQRVVIGPWRTPIMTTLTRYGVAAAALVLLVGAGAFLVRPQPTGVTGAPTPTPSASPTPVISPTPVPYAVGPGPVALADGLVSLVVTVPEGATGWSHEPGDAGLWKNYGPDGGDPGPVIILWDITGTFVDPCTDHTRKLPAPAGVEDLIAELGNQAGLSSGPATDVTISGYKGQYVETTVTADINACVNGDGFWLWASPGGDRRYVQDTGEINRMYAIDVDGRRFTFDVRLPPTTTAADRAEVETMLDTLEIQLQSASPSPSQP